MPGIDFVQYFAKAKPLWPSMMLAALLKYESW